MPLGAARITLLARSAVTAVAEVIRSKVGVSPVQDAQIDTAQSKFGGSSALFDGTGDYLIHKGPVLPSTDDFTAECWVRFSDTSADKCLISQHGDVGSSNAANRFFIASQGSNKIDVYLRNSSNTDWAFRIFGSTILSTNVWYHIAVVRNSNTFTLYINGSSDGTASSSNPIIQSDFVIGALSNSGAYDLIGHIDEVRISNTARYTSGFTPSTTPFVNDENTLLLLHMDGTDASTHFEDDNGQRAKKGVIAYGNAQVDTARSKFSGSSALFDGTGDYLGITDSSDSLKLTSGNAFTIEAWVYVTGVGGQIFTESILPSPYTIGFTLGLGGSVGTTNDYKPWFGYYNGSWNGVISASNISTSTWTHIAGVYDGTNTTLYVNGTSVATSSSLSWVSSYTLNEIFVGRRWDTDNNVYFNGSIDELRVSNTARYTSGFTPSTTPFVNDANTLLLLHMNGFDTTTVFVDDNQNVYLQPTAALTDDSSTELLLHMDGSAGGTTFTDDNSSGRTAKTLTRYSVTTETAQKQFGTASMLSSTASAYGLQVTGTTNLVTWHNTDFCVEAWVYATSYTNITGGTYGGIPTGKVIGNVARTGSSNYWSFGPTSTGALSWYMWDPSVGSRGFVTPQTPVTLNTWHHIVVQHTLANRLLTFFCDGEKIGEWGVTSHNNLAVDSSTGIVVGGYDSKGFPGYIDEVRVSRTLRY